MVALPYQSNAKDYPSQDFQPIPPGKYPAVILEASLHANKAGNGQYFKFKWQIAEGPFVGRVIFSQHNVVNSNPDAERIGRTEIQSFATALGIEELADTADLIGKPMLASVTLREDKTGRYQPQNGVNRASPYEAGGDVPFDNPKPAPAQRPLSHGSSAPASSGRMGGSPVASAGAMQSSRASAARAGTRANPFAE